MNFTYYFLLLFLLQTTTGEIMITLQDVSEKPIIGETFEFWPESSPTALGSCITDQNGTCTITVDAAVDASGLIRGTIAFSSGKRPVIWPGGTLTLTLTLEAGQFNTNSDAYVTRTPKIVATETVVLDTEGTEGTQGTQGTEEALDTEGTQDTEGTEEALDTEDTEEALSTKEPLSTEETLNTKEPAKEEEHKTPIEALIFRGFLILILICTLIFYMWKTKQ